jgi:hypothetical protein
VVEAEQRPLGVAALAGVENRPADAAAAEVDAREAAVVPEGGHAREASADEVRHELRLLDEREVAGRAAPAARAQREDFDAHADDVGLDAVPVRQPEERARIRVRVAEEDVHAERDRIAVVLGRLDETGADDAEAVVPSGAHPAADLPGVAAGEAQPPGTAAGVVPAERAEPAEVGVVQRPAPAKVLDEDRAVGDLEARDVARADRDAPRRRAARPHRPRAVAVRDEDGARTELHADARLVRSAGPTGERERE